MNTFTLERNNYRRKLITLVKQNPILWNKTQENYNRNRPQKILAWHQISEQLGITVDKLRRTWENLRDQYRRDLKREVRFGFKSKWRFFSDMDFIRAMVSCKDEVREHDFTDSDSELDVVENRNLQCRTVTTTLIPTTTCQTLTTPCSSTAPANITYSSNVWPFKPIILSKQWLPAAQEVAQVNNVPSTSCYSERNTTPLSLAAVELPTNCDSSKDCTKRSNTLLVCETVAKEEADSDLEPDNASALKEHSVATVDLLTSCDSSKDYTKSPNALLTCDTVVKVEPELDVDQDNACALKQQQTSALAKDTANVTEFQEPCVSTSSQKQSRASIEEISDTTMPANSQSQIKCETNLSVKDDEYYFVMSLLPSLRQIPRNRKIPLRIGIMNLIAKDLEEVCKE